MDAGTGVWDGAGSSMGEGEKINGLLLAADGVQKEGEEGEKKGRKDKKDKKHKRKAEKDGEELCSGGSLALQSYRCTDVQRTSGQLCFFRIMQQVMLEKRSRRRSGRRKRET